MLDAKTLGPQRCGDDWDVVGESLHDLVPGATPGADRNHDHVGAGQFSGHVGHPTRHGDVGWLVQGFDPTGRVPTSRIRVPGSCWRISGAMSRTNHSAASALGS